MNLEGRVAIITGGGGHGELFGIGRAICSVLSHEGAKLVVVDISEAEAMATVNEIKAQGGEAIAVIGDVSKAETAKRAADEANRNFGRLDILVNNAATVGPSTTVVEVLESDWDRVLAINVKGPMLMSKYAIPLMGRGSAIVNIGSIGAIRSSLRTAYAASKGALASLTIVMAAHHGPAGIRVNCVNPGLIWTPMVAKEAPSEIVGATMRENRRQANLLQEEGTAWDIAKTVGFLVSDDARWITGQNIYVDAGVTVARPGGPPRGAGG
jgi:NAD(P)-dependent dehydrogenase (short-subunit alcohol dehydrogenase family)